MSTTPLRSTGGANRRGREPLADSQLERAQQFAVRVIRGAAKIVKPDVSPTPVGGTSGPQFYCAETIIDGDLEYTVIVWATRRRNALEPDILP